MDSIVNVEEFCGRKDITEVGHSVTEVPIKCKYHLNYYCSQVNVKGTICRLGRFPPIHKDCALGISRQPDSSLCSQSDKDKKDWGFLSYVISGHYKIMTSNAVSELARMLRKENT